MKSFTNKFLAAVLLIAGMLSFQDAYGQKIKHYMIKGFLENMNPMPAKIYVVYDNVLGKSTDSSKVINGKYEIQGTIDICFPVYMALDPKAPLTKDANHYTLVIDEGNFELHSNGTLANTVVTGDGAGVHKEFQKVTLPAQMESEALSQLRKDPAYATSDSLQQMVKKRGTNLIYTALTSLISYVRANPESQVTPFLTYNLIGSGLLTSQMIDTLMSSFPGRLRTSSVGKGLDKILSQRRTTEAEAAAKKVALDQEIPIGGKAADFTMADVQGKPVSLSSFRGKYVLVDFWASWCKPCREENPNLVNAYQRYKNKGLNILGISLDGKSQKSAWLEAIKQDGLVWTHLSDLKGFENEAAKLFKVVSIPQNFLINPEGIIIAKNLRAEELNIKLAEVFK